MSNNFNYKTLQDLQQDIKNHNIALNCATSFDALQKPVQLKNHAIPNSVCAHPMEGGDAISIGIKSGAPGPLTFRKYQRVAAGGFGLIWVEAVSICDEGRSNPGQLWINEQTLPGFKELVQKTHEAATAKPIIVMQLNHSGRYSKPQGKHAPIIASHIPELDARFNIDETYPIVTDEYLQGLVAQFVKAAKLAYEAGFDGVDVKACHGYLLHELLSCRTRQGEYGGSFTNRTKLMLQIIDEIRAAIPNPKFIIASRINIFDALPQYHGFGMASPGATEPDLTEPIELTKAMVARGVELVSITMGNPYFIPHINRPYDLGAYPPPEHPLLGAYRLIKSAADLQSAVPAAKIVGVGYSWFRRFSPHIAAAVLEEGKAAMIGFGRQILSYPDIYNDIATGQIDSSRVCVSCSKCSFLKRDAGTCGCVVRDAEAYLQLYRDTYPRHCHVGDAAFGVPQIERDANTMKKTAIITGGTRGIGLAIAQTLSAEGYNIVITGRGKEAQSLPANALYVQSDISQKQARENLVTETIAHFGRIDILINNAGVAPANRTDLLEMTEESFDHVLNVNLKGAFFLSQLVANHMVQANITDGRIIFISSISAYTSSTNRGEYCISKAALSMVRALFADRLAEEGIHVFEVRPGVIQTDMTAGVAEKYDKLIAEGLSPIKRWGKPEDVAGVVKLLCRDEFAFSTGDVINVDGGFHIRRL